MGSTLLKNPLSKKTQSHILSLIPAGVSPNWRFSPF
jgi:hypothetical protein